MKAVEHHYRVLVENFDAFDVLVEVFQAAFHRVGIEFLQLVGVFSAVQLERTNGCNQNHRIRIQTGRAALDIEELLRAQVKTEPRFGDGPVGEVHRHPGCEYAVATVRDIGERSAVHEDGGTVQRLHQVGMHGVAQQGQQHICDAQ